MRLATVQRGAGILQAIGDQTRFMFLACQLATELVIQVDHPAAQVRPGEQTCLGLGISLHAAVVIQVVARKVGHDRNIERQRRNAALIQGVG
ncbi:hypothetical protein D3C85_1230920 [compost metagenome]